jgi:hypothetical protein
MRWLVIGAAVFVVGLGSAVAQPPPPPGYAPIPPPGYAPIPPPRYEPIPPPPGGPMVWQPGHWHWDGYRYVWIGGHYVPTRPHWRRWEEGRWFWSPRQGRWIWRPAQWE